MVVRTVQDFLGSTKQCTRSPAKCIQVIIRALQDVWAPGFSGAKFPGTGAHRH